MKSPTTDPYENWLATATCSQAGACVISNPGNFRDLKSIKKGFREARGDIIATIEAHGEHDAGEIPRLVKSVQRGDAEFRSGEIWRYNLNLKPCARNAFTIEIPQFSSSSEGAPKAQSPSGRRSKIVANRP